MNKEERDRAYRHNHRDSIRAYLKAWEREHRAWRKEYNRRYYLAHRNDIIRRVTERKAATKNDGRTETEKIITQSRKTDMATSS